MLAFPTKKLASMIILKAKNIIGLRMVFTSFPAFFLCQAPETLPGSSGSETCYCSLAEGLSPPVCVEEKHLCRVVERDRISKISGGIVFYRASSSFSQSPRDKRKSSWQMKAARNFSYWLPSWTFWESWQRRLQTMTWLWGAWQQVVSANRLQQEVMYLVGVAWHFTMAGSVLRATKLPFGGYCNFEHDLLNGLL